MFKHTFGKIALAGVVMLGFVPRLPSQTFHPQTSERTRVSERAPDQWDGNAFANFVPGDDSRFLRMNAKPAQEHPRLWFGHLEIRGHNVPPWKPQPPFYLQIHESGIDLRWKNP